MSFSIQAMGARPAIMRVGSQIRESCAKKCCNGLGQASSASVDSELLLELQQLRLLVVAPINGGTFVYDILVVEDDDLVRWMLIDVLEDRGFIAHEARTLDDALAAIAVPGCCKVLVTDIDLGGGVDGFEVADRMRQCIPGIPVLFITGRPWLLEGRTNPGDQTLPKPFGVEALVTAVRELMPA